MGLRDQLDWARSEWAIFAQRESMSFSHAVEWASQWVPLGIRTVAYGTVSIVLGPLSKDRAVSAWAMKRWSAASLSSLGVDARCDGEHLVPDGGVMYASNHQSSLDILVLGAHLPGDVKWAVKQSLMSVPFVGWHLTLGGHVPVDRSADRRAAAKVIRRFEQVLSDDLKLLVFPEGTRAEDGCLQPFKSGGFYAAVRAGKPVIPVAIDGTYRLMRKHAPNLRASRRQRVNVALGAPLFPRTDGKERARVDDLRDRTHAAVTALLQQMPGRVGDPADGPASGPADDPADNPASGD